MLKRTRRLLGLARSSSAYRNWDDPRSFGDFDPVAAGWVPVPDGNHPDWKDDLESLFKLVDSRMTERRSAVAGPAEGQAERRRVGPEPPQAHPPLEVVPAIAPPEPPSDSWLGFGLEEEEPIVVDQPAGVEQLAGQVTSQVRAALLGGELTAAVRAAAREAVDEALRDRLAAEVKAGVEDALREAAAAWDDEQRIAPSTILSIRVRQRRSRRSA